MLRMVGRVNRHDTDNCCLPAPFPNVTRSCESLQIVQASVIAECSVRLPSTGLSPPARSVLNPGEPELRVMAFPHGDAYVCQPR
jgi:hypothetical protein